MAMYQQMETGIQGHLLDSLYTSPAAGSTHAVHMHIYRERETIYMYIDIHRYIYILSSKLSQPERGAVWGCWCGLLVQVLCMNVLSVCGWSRMNVYVWCVQVFCACVPSGNTCPASLLVEHEAVLVSALLDCQIWSVWLLCCHDAIKLSQKHSK